MTTQQWINVLGLVFDIIGVLMLFVFGLPADLNKNGYIFKVNEEEDEEQKSKWRKYDKFSKIALTAIIIGFLMQMLSTIWPSITC